MADEPRRIAILRVTLPLLLDALNLPPDTELQDIRLSFDQPLVVEMRVEHAELRPLGAGQRIPAISAELRTEIVEGPGRAVRFTRWLYFDRAPGEGASNA